jgi:hypothetical protein
MIWDVPLATFRAGNYSADFLHYKHEFRKFGRDTSGPFLVAAMDAEINRLERQTVTLRRLQVSLLGVV